MSIESHRCYVLVCDDCAKVYDVDTAGYVVHFDTPDLAIEDAARSGWTVSESGVIRCYECAAGYECGIQGHAMSVWIPCMCGGKIPDHALFGCGLFRFCHRDCRHIENTTLAAITATNTTETSEPFENG